MPKCYLKPRQDNGIYYIWEYDDASGKCRHISTRTRDPAEAQQALAKHILALPQRLTPTDSITILQVLLRYWELYAKDLFSKDTVKAVLAAVVEHEPETTVSGFSIPKQIALAEKLGKTPSTARRYMGVIRASLQWAFDRGELASMPAVYKVKAQDAAGVLPYSVDELKKICEACQTETERTFILLCIATAPRPAATLDVSWDRINKDTHVIDYDVPGREKTKKRRARAPLPEAAWRYLEARRSLGPVVQYGGKQLGSYKSMFERIANRAGVAGSAYGIRKAVAIWLRKQAVPEWDAKGMLGHSIGMTEVYAQYRPEYMRVAADAVQALLVALNPSWLSSHLPAPEVPKTQVYDFNGVIGGRTRDRTWDPYHVKDTQPAPFQPLRAANDD